MKEIFDIKRFGKYFTFDLNNAWEKYGFTLLIMGFFPVIFYAVMTLIHLVFGGDVANEPTVYQVFPAFIFIFVCLGFGAKVYGSVTERRSGTDWIALPASALEKTLSLLLLTCIVLPACLLGLLFLSQAIVSLFVTDLPPLFSIIGDLHSKVAENDVFFNIPLCLWISWVENILAFTLGALCFKKNKVGKTFLCLMAFCFVISSLMMFFFGKTSFNGSDIELLFGDNFDITRVQNWINAVLNVIYFVVIGGLIAGIWARIKTIKA